MTAWQGKTSPFSPGEVFRIFRDVKQMTDDLLQKGPRDRSHIAISQRHEVQYWMRHLGVTREELHRAIEKVGTSAAAVRKELKLTEAPR